MANAAAILQKLARNLDQLDIAESQGLNTVTAGADSLVVSYVNASLQSPMAGIDDTVSPYLGIGIAAPGKLKIKGAAGQNTVAAIMHNAENLQILKLVGDFGNNVQLEAGDTTTLLAEIKSYVDGVMYGQ